jgi:ribosomal protein S18 acetylase RimI-like enzyme
MRESLDAEAGGLDASYDGDRYLLAAAQLLRLLATADGAESMRIGDVLAVVTGIPSNAENGVIGAPGAGASRRRNIAALVEFVQRHRVPASWLLDRPAILGAGLTDALVAGGCRPETDAWLMGGPVSAPDAAQPDGVEITPVRTAAHLEDWLRVAAACGWIDSHESLAARTRIYGSLPLDGPWRRWIATQDGVPLGMAAALVTSEVVYMTDSAVIPEARRRGIGRALALARLRFGREHDCKRAILAPSPDGAELWRSMGFVESRQPRNRWFYLPYAAA